MIAIVDYGMGNLKNIYKALKYVGADCTITSDPDTVNSADGIVLPGVGAFKDAMESIRKNGLDESVKSAVSQGKPFLGICLGMQLLFDKSFENGEHPGFSILKGEVKLLPQDVKVPHMGWNSINIIKRDPIMQGVKNPTVYFIHSYHCVPSEDIVTGTAEYSIDVTASVCKDNINALQFHPEKSGAAGIKMLDNFRRML